MSPQRRGWRPSPFQPHDPIYTLGWIAFIVIVGAILLAAFDKAIPEELKTIGAGATGALANAASTKGRPR